MPCLRDRLEVEGTAKARSWVLAAATAIALPTTACGSPHLLDLSRPSAAPGDELTLTGRDFGRQPGWAVLTGRRIEADRWSDTRITLTVPDDGASGWVRVRRPDGAASGELPFSVVRTLPEGQIAPEGLTLQDTGLLGAAFLVETDGTNLYGVAGFETLVTYALRDSRPHHTFSSRFYLNQRIADLRVHGGHLFCVGDGGLTIYRCQDLQQGRLAAVASIAGGSFLAVDAQPDPIGEVDGAIVALCEHAPAWGTNVVRVVFYQFAGEELSRLGTFSRAVGPTERQHGLALDPLNRKAYVSGWEALTGANKYILELNTADLSLPTVHHREDTGATLAYDLEAVDEILWAGLALAKTELFGSYTLQAGGGHLASNLFIRGGFSLGRVTRVKILDRRLAAGSAWYGQRPDIYLFDAAGTNAVPLATEDSLDWAFDITGYSRRDGSDTGCLIVADEWGGFLTLDYGPPPHRVLTHRPDYQWVVASAMTEGLCLAEDRIYIAGRGAGPWSADRFHLSDASQWRRVEFDWNQDEPQPHPVSALAVRRDPQAGLLIAALGHEKAMAWGNQIIGQLFRETGTQIEWLAQSEPFDPPGLYSSGVDAVWPEPDLVYMTTGSDGFRAYVVDPRAPSMTLHRDCRNVGFETNTFSTANSAQCMKYWESGTKRRLIVGSIPGLLVNEPTLHLFNVSYPDGVPDRQNPDAPIRVAKEAALNCLEFKTVHRVDVRPSGVLALATSHGLAILHPARIPALNRLPTFQAWDQIRVKAQCFEPWWDASWGAAVKDVSFVDDRTLYAVKAPHGVWRMTFEIDPATQGLSCQAVGFYPGVECGMDYASMLHGWADPDIPTLHHPYGVVADGDTVYVTGWSGKVQALSWAGETGAWIEHLALGAARLDLTFVSPWGGRDFRIDARPGLDAGPWSPLPDIGIYPCGAGTYRAWGPLLHDPAHVFRVTAPSEKP